MEDKKKIISQFMEFYDNGSVDTCLSILKALNEMKKNETEKISIDDCIEFIQMFLFDIQKDKDECQNYDEFIEEMIYFTNDEDVTKH